MCRSLVDPLTAAIRMCPSAETRSAPPRAVRPDSQVCADQSMAFGAVSPVATRSASSPLVRHVSLIISHSALKQMAWANTRRRIALVTHTQASGDWAIRQLVSQTVGQNSPDRPVETEPSVALPVASACPQPAVARAVNLGPEAVRGRLGVHHGAPFRGATLGAVASGARALTCPAIIPVSLAQAPNRSRL